MRRLFLFHKIYNLKSSKYLYNLIPSVNRFYDTRNNTNVSSFKCRTEFLRILSFQMSSLNGTNLTLILNTAYTAFKNALLSSIRPKHVDTFRIHNPIGLQLLTRLRLGFSHLSTNSGIISVISLILYPSVSQNQRQHPTFSYAATYSR